MGCISFSAEWMSHELSREKKIRYLWLVFAKNNMVIRGGGVGWGRMGGVRDIPLEIFLQFLFFKLCLQILYCFVNLSTFAGVFRQIRYIWLLILLHRSRNLWNVNCIYELSIMNCGFKSFFCMFIHIFIRILTKGVNINPAWYFICHQTCGFFVTCDLYLQILLYKLWLIL